MLFVERSNRTEVLFEGLAARLGRSGRDPLARAVIVVQGAGMERWIAQQLARRHGVCAHVAFPFPRPFLEQVFEVLPGSVAGGGNAVETPPAPWDLDRMTWAIAGLIDAGAGDAEFAPLARHVVGGDGAWRLIQLARQIANVFDQYITYRPDWILHWEGEAPAPVDLPAGVDAAWQRRLFRALRDVLGPGHIANRAVAFLASLGQSPLPARGRVGSPRERRALEAALRERFPDAVEVFAVSTLPRLHLEVVRGLATVLDVRLSILAPSRAWYSELWRELREDEGAGGSPVAILLASLGRLGADFQRILVEAAAADGGERELFVVPEAERADASLLARLQSRLLDLDDAEQAPAARRVARDDDSIRVHLCPGPRRELEVVEGILRLAFARDPSLRPEDVIVMAPDIDAIAGDVDAVFGPGADEPGGIPYRIADRGTYRRSPVADAFRTLLALIGTRMARSAVFDWLALAPVAARFGLDEAAVEALGDWAVRAGVRFGLDEGQRAALGLPADRAHTLSGGLDRLVLAHALGDGPEVVEGLSPVALDAFADASWLGALGEVETLLASAVREQRVPRPVAAWTRWLEALQGAALVRNDANSHEHAMLRAVLERLRTSAEATGFDCPIPYEAIRERVISALEESPAPQAFLAGGVTFCQLVPLRAIPFRVVVVTGLVDGAFPRSRADVGFDAMARRPRPGDRRLRDDDRHLFLEAILSARERLVLTVPAQDVRSGEQLPASIVVAELLDALAASFVLEGPEDVKLRDWLLVSHPLHESSPRYFAPGRARDRDPRLVSRSERAHRTAVARATAEAEGVRPVRRFLAQGDSLPAAGADRGAASKLVARESQATLELEDLIERVLRSTRHFAREGLGLALPRPETAVDDLDPVALDPLAESEVGRGVFDALQADVGWEAALARLRSDPLLASGHAGELAARPLAAEARALAAIAAAERARAGAPRADAAFELEIPATTGKGGLPTRLLGRLDGLFEGARIEAGFARLGGRREAALWIRHLVLCALRARGERLPDRSIAVGRPARGDKAEHRVALLGPVDDPLALLSLLVDWAKSSTEAPLPFFERASRTFADVIFAKQPPDEAKAWRDARSAFEGRDDGGFRRAEVDEELELARVWEGLSPIAPAAESGLEPGFDDVARSFFEPLFGARERRRG